MYIGEDHVVAVKLLVGKYAAHGVTVDGSHEGESGVGVVEW